MKGENWQPLRDFPLVYRQKIWYYSMVNFKGDLYLFGGVSDNYRPLDGAYKFSKNGKFNTSNHKILFSKFPLIFYLTDTGENVQK